MRRLILINFMLLTMVACAAPQVVSPDLARETVTNAWETDQHIVWEIDWPAAPSGGPLTVETWRSGDRYRFEILEAAPPALVGETLIFDGQTAWRYNRFDPPPSFTPTSPSLSPVSDAFTIIDRLIKRLPETATQTATQVNSRPAQCITLTFANGDRLVLWQDTETELPVRIHFSVDRQQATLEARHFEPLPDPPPELFSVGDWIIGIR